ncbi:hypothetical protein T01_14045 [Trichinella spiralis]|uniref:Uncharacterized protein n=1 Tax=Trichinella spiralis TaxID=6334 RepID=A0A0V1BRX5_TRISP|nr:hypothetical protein T01_14045 [Trichinella spiralis]
MGEKQLGPSEFRPTSVGTDAEKAVPEVNKSGRRSVRMNDDQNEQADLGLPNFIRPSQTPTGKQFNSNRPSSVCCPPVRMESSPVMAAARRRQPTPAVAEGQPPTSPFPFHNIQADKTLVHVVNRNGYALDKLLNGCCCRIHNQDRKLVPEGNIDQFGKSDVSCWLKTLKMLNFNVHLY